MKEGTVLEKIAVALINHKGGVGKTTLAVVLSQIALKAGAKVTAVDLDPQKNFSDALALIQDRHTGNLTVTDEITEAGEVIILDCPPALGDATSRAMDFSDITLVPVYPDMFSLSNLGVVHEFGKAHGKAFEQLAIVKVGFAVKAKTKGLTEIAAAALTELGYVVAGDVPINRLIPYNIISGRAWSAGIPVPARTPCIRLYRQILGAYERMLEGNFKTAWQVNEDAGA
jgi:cellulose biosynthesis protein BcsQ